MEVATQPPNRSDERVLGDRGGVCGIRHVISQAGQAGFLKFLLSLVLKYSIYVTGRGFDEFWRQVFILRHDWCPLEGLIPLFEMFPELTTPGIGWEDFTKARRVRVTKLVT
jgi:hypothetical protein